MGWGGFFAVTFGPPLPANLFQEQLNDEITEGSGEELILMEPDSLRAAMNRYLDKGVDFVKYGGTVHMSNPTTLVFSPRQAQVIVAETHKRGKPAETHATSPEAAREPTFHPLLALRGGVAAKRPGWCARHATTPSASLRSAATPPRFARRG